MIFMQGQDGRVHIITEALVNAKTLCTYYEVARDGLHEVGDLPSCSECAYVYIRNLEETWLPAGNGRQDVEGDEFAYWLRSLLIDATIVIEEEMIPSDAPLSPAVKHALGEARMCIQILEQDDYVGRERLTELLLESSLCPMHRGDYQACFDDEVAECAAIRLIHPEHDT